MGQKHVSECSWKTLKGCRSGSYLDLFFMRIVFIILEHHLQQYKAGGEKEYLEAIGLYSKENNIAFSPEQVEEPCRR